MPKKVFWLILLLVLIIGGAIYALTNKSSLTESEKLLAEDAKLYLYTVGSEPSGQLALSLPFSRAQKSGEIFWVDLGLDLDQNQKIDQNEWLVKTQKTSLVQNLRNNFLIADPEKKLKINDEVLVKINLTKLPEKDYLETLEKKITVEAFEIGDLLGYGVASDNEEIKRGLGLPQLISQTARAQAEGEEIFRNANTPDLAQGNMECAAVSVANNMISLGAENDRLNDLPEFTGELIEELKKDMKYNEGILLPDIVPGKNAFAQRHNLPISSELILAPTAEQVRQALASGAAVELSMNFTRSRSGRRGTGHVVTLVGAAADQFFVHDSGTPEGMDTLDVNATVKTKNAEFVGVNYPFWDGVAYVDAIIVQNWTEAKKAEESYTDTGEQGSLVECLVINGSYFPKSQFRVAQPDACDGSHYHGGPVYGFKDKNSKEIISLQDPNSSACGFGKVSEVPVEQITLTFDQSAELIKYLPD